MPGARVTMPGARGAMPGARVAMRDACGIMPAWGYEPR
jgi:hypothetical protein